MSDEGRRRRSDPQPDDSIITKAAKMEIGGPVLDKLVRVVLMILVSGGAGTFMSEKKNVEVTLLQTQIQEHKDEFEEWKTKYWERRRREIADDEKLHRELLDRLLVTETKVQLLGR